MIVPPAFGLVPLLVAVGVFAWVARELLRKERDESVVGTEPPLPLLYTRRTRAWWAGGCFAGGLVVGCLFVTVVRLPNSQLEYLHGFTEQGREYRQLIDRDLNPREAQTRFNLCQKHFRVAVNRGGGSWEEVAVREDYFMTGCAPTEEPPATPTTSEGGA